MTSQTNQQFRRHRLTLISLLVLLWQLLLPAASAQAATLTVCPSGCAFNRIQDAMAVASPGDTIAIGVGTYLENLTIDKNLTLQGTGQASTIINGRGLARVVIIEPGRIVTIANMTIMNGFSEHGGGILSLEGSQLTLTQSIIHNNIAIHRGGGLYAVGANIITIRDSTFSANKQLDDFNGGGAAIFAEPSSELSIHNSTIVGNAAGTQSSTNAEDGGGIVSFWSTTTIINSTISGNTAPNRGGGIYSAGTMTLINTTVSDNAGSEGGGIINAGGAPSEIILRNSIIGNSVSGGDCVNLGLFTDAGYNLVEDGSCITAATSRAGDPGLDALADNGGATLTHALLANSPAIDGVGTDACTVETDQRGVARPQPNGGQCDIGAFELERAANNVNNVIFVSSTAGGRIGDVRFDDEDILAYNLETGVWSKYFDGSRVGLVHNDINAFTLLDDGSILLSFNSPQFVPGLGWVTDADIVKFTAPAQVQAGIPAAGRFAWYLDGSDVGLQSGHENIDSISRTTDGRLLISTRGPFAASGVRGNDEDLFVLNDATFGAASAGHWALYFDGSDVGLNANSEDINGAWLDPTTGALYLTTEGWFSVAGLNGDANDIILCTPGALGDNTQCTFSLFWDGAKAGFSRGRIDGLALGNSAQLAASTLLNNSGDDLNDATIDDTEEDADDIDPFGDEEESDAQTHQIFLPVMTR